MTAVAGIYVIVDSLRRRTLPTPPVQSSSTATPANAMRRVFASHAEDPHIALNWSNTAQGARLGGIPGTAVACIRAMRQFKPAGLPGVYV
jgi:hypothetical protein